MEYAIQTNHTTPLTSNLTDQLKDNTKTADTTKVKENLKSVQGQTRENIEKQQK